MPVEVETVLHLATRRRYVLGAVSVHHMIEQEVWLEPAMALFNMWKPGRGVFRQTYR